MAPSVRRGSRGAVVPRILLGLAFSILLAPAPGWGLGFLIEPYLQNQGATSMVVSWRTDQAASTTVLYGPSPAQLTPIDLSGTRQQHEVPITGLSPDTVYYYKVSSQVGSVVVESTVSTFRTSSHKSKFRFVFITDTQTDPSVNRSFTDDILGFGPEVLFHGGDHVDVGNDIDGEWLSYFDSSKDYLKVKPQFNAIGNHNYRTDPLGIGHDEAQTTLLLFAQPGNERWFTVRRGPVLFIVLDANNDHYQQVTTVEPGWLEQVLVDATDGVDDPLLKVAVFHHPPYSSGLHTMEFPNVEFEDEFVQQEFVPRFEQYGVNLVLNGHEHFYERSRKAGIVYLICGSAGGGPRGKVGSNQYSELLVENVHSIFLGEIDINRIDIDVVQPDGSLIESVRVEVLAIRTESLPSGTVGIPYQATLEASGGQAPLTFSLLSGSLPTGIAMDPATGDLLGTPTVSGTFSFRVRVSDQTGETHERDLEIDVNPTLVERIISGPGASATNPPLVHTFDEAGTQVGAGFLAYGTSAWGVGPTAGDVSSSGKEEILTGPGPGAMFGPQVRAFQPGGTPVSKVNYYAYGTLRYGVNVTAGDLDSDAWAEVLTGAGSGDVFGPHLRGWNVDGGSVAAMAGINAFVYATLKFGVNPGAGDIEGDGFAEVMTGPGPGIIFGPHLRGFDVDGSPLRPLSWINGFVFGTTQYGLVVGGADLDDDANGEILAGKGPGPTFDSEVAAFDADQPPLSNLLRQVAYAGSLYGTRVGGGELDGSSGDELLTGPGPDPVQPALVRTWQLSAGSLSQLMSFDAYPGTGVSYGVKVGAGSL